MEWKRPNLVSECCSKIKTEFSGLSNVHKIKTGVFSNVQQIKSELLELSNDQQIKKCFWNDHQIKTEFSGLSNVH